MAATLLEQREQGVVIVNPRPEGVWSLRFFLPAFEPSKPSSSDGGMLSSQAVVLGAQWVAGRSDKVLAKAARDVIAKITAAVPERLRPFVLQPSVGARPASGAPTESMDAAQLRAAIHAGCQSASAVDPCVLNILKSLPRRSASRPHADFHSEAKKFAAKADAKADKALEKIEAHKLYAANEFARKDEINPTLRRIEDKIDSLREHRRPATAAD